MHSAHSLSALLLTTIKILMDLWSILVALSLTFILIQSLHFLANLLHTSKNKLPPGPNPLPVIGNLHILGHKPHQSLAELAQVYGPIMSLKLGRVTTIVISSSSAANEVLKTKDLAFSSRFVLDAVNVHNHSQNSVVWIPVGTKWRNIRKIMSTLIFSSNRLDANRHLRAGKVKELIAYCDSCCKAGKTVDIGKSAFRTSLNLMSNTIFSKDLTDRFQDSAKDFKELIENIMMEIGKPNLADYFPLLKMIDLQGIRRRSKVCFGKLLETFDVLIKERLESRKARKIAGNGDVLDLCLDICEERPEEIDIPNLRNMCLDFFFGGTDTTSSTLEWGMAELLHNPEIMKRAKMELDEMIGRGNIVDESDIHRLPYLQCIMKETLRLHPPVPLLVPRKVESDNIEVNGYVVPKGSQVLVNAWAIGRDPSLWEESLTFKPERFLTLERDIKGLDFELIPFGAGRRICPGLSLAMRMLFVMLGSLVNSFEWKLDGGIGPEDLDMSEKFGITLHKAKPLRIIPLKLAT